MKLTFGHFGATDRPLLVTLDPLWGHFGATLEALWSHLGHMRVTLAPLGGNLNSLWDHFGVTFGIWRWLWFTFGSLCYHCRVILSLRLPPHMLTFMFACCATWTIVALHFVEIMFTCHSHLIEFMFTCIWIIILSSILSMPLYYLISPLPHVDHLLVLFWFLSGDFLGYFLVAFWVTFWSLSVTCWSFKCAF